MVINYTKYQKYPIEEIVINLKKDIPLEMMLEEGFFDNILKEDQGRSVSKYLSKDELKEELSSICVENLNNHEIADFCISYLSINNPKNVCKNMADIVKNYSGSRRKEKTARSLLDIFWYEVDINKLIKENYIELVLKSFTKFGYEESIKLISIFKRVLKEIDVFVKIDFMPFRSIEDYNLYCGFKIRNNVYLFSIGDEYMEYAKKWHDKLLEIDRTDEMFKTMTADLYDDDDFEVQ
jgi:hypothetical protein